MIYRSPHPDIPIPDRTVPGLVFSNAATYGDKPALVDGPTGRTITYNHLVALTRRLAAGLSERGFKKGDCLALYSPNVPEYPVVFHGVASIGGIVTTVNPLYTAGELHQQLLDSKPKYLVTIPQFLATAQEAAKDTSVAEMFVFGQAEGATPFAALLTSDVAPPDVTINPREDLIALPYSSGTTGLPKGVMLTHHNLVAECSVIDVAPDTEFPRYDDVVIAFLPFFHIYGIVAFLNFCLWKGATVITMPRFDLEQYLAMVQNHKVTYLHIVPPVALAMAKHPIVDKYDLSSARLALSAAAPLGESVAQAFMARLGIPIFQAYGMTEVSGATHLGATTPDKLKPHSAGRVLPNTECKVVDLPTGNLMGPGEQGEIWVRGPLIMKGYLGRPDATRNTIDADGWLRTGDIGYADEDGDFFIVDRSKELIKYKGLQIAPAELEAVLLAHPAIADVAVIPIRDEEAGEVPKAFIVRKSDVTAEDVQAFVAARVAPHKKIRQVEFVDAIPKSASGKILRRVLIEQERAKEAPKAV